MLANEDVCSALRFFKIYIFQKVNKKQQQAIAASVGIHKLTIKSEIL
jgi:hypothetical protein